MNSHVSAWSSRPRFKPRHDDTGPPIAARVPRSGLLFTSVREREAAHSLPATSITQPPARGHPQITSHAKGVGGYQQTVTLCVRGEG
ncbi:hypothetical protein EVAR_81894_1 [Eumeta japonica]|uniref:Uncharacterized protein n=1 Tax=Eumeta variegata TaxID=151549 RepID=A0A4C1UYA3_EUMVA|nr:hypothetical protein EVAR_81894_1 [Eumeta japonica]